MSVAVERSSSRGKPADRAWNIPPLVRGAGGELPEGFALGEWTVTHLRGTEASCEVYLVTHAVDGSSCVARVARRSALAARPGLAGAMLAGAKLLGKLRHPNLLAVCGHGWTDETAPRPYVLHERVVGRDLAAYQARHGGVEPGLLLAVASQCAAALEAMHAAGLAHADLWRGCAVLVPVGGGACQVKLGGLELAQKIRAGATADEEPLVAADLAALGAMLGELAEDVAGVPPALTELVARLADPQQMPRSAAEVRAALAAIQGADPGASVVAEPALPLRMAGTSGLWSAREFGQVSPVMPHERPARPRRSAARAAGVGALIVGALAGLIMMLAGRSVAPELRRLEVGGEARVEAAAVRGEDDADAGAGVRSMGEGVRSTGAGVRSTGEGVRSTGEGAGETGECADVRSMGEGAGETGECADVRSMGEGAGEEMGVRSTGEVRGEGADVWCTGEVRGEGAGGRGAGEAGVVRGEGETGGAGVWGEVRGKSAGRGAGEGVVRGEHETGVRSTGEVRGRSAGRSAGEAGVGRGEGETVGGAAVRSSGEETGARSEAGRRGEGGAGGASRRSGSSGSRTKVEPVQVVPPPVEAVPVPEPPEPAPPVAVEEADDGLLPVVRGKAEVAEAGPFLKTTGGA